MVKSIEYGHHVRTKSLACAHIVELHALYPQSLLAPKFLRPALQLFGHNPERDEQLLPD
jgi:hypothetical protein